jgi:hypothetical protein
MQRVGKRLRAKLARSAKRIKRSIRCCKGRRNDRTQTGPSDNGRHRSGPSSPLQDLRSTSSRHLLHQELEGRLYSPVDALSTEKRTDDDSGGCLHRPFGTSTWHNAALAESDARAPPRARHHVHGQWRQLYKLLSYPYRMLGVCRRPPKRPQKPLRAVVRGRPLLVNDRRHHIHLSIRSLSHRRFAEARQQSAGRRPVVLHILPLLVTGSESLGGFAAADRDLLTNASLLV